LTAKGYGPDEPLDTNDTEAGKEKNRRVEFRVGAPLGKADPASMPASMPAVKKP
jgi:hypothetical protein